MLTCPKIIFLSLSPDNIAVQSVVSEPGFPGHLGRHHYCLVVRGCVEINPIFWTAWWCIWASSVSSLRGIRESPKTGEGVCVGSVKIINGESGTFTSWQLPRYPAEGKNIFLVKNFRYVYTILTYSQLRVPAIVFTMFGHLPDYFEFCGEIGWFVAG